MSFSYLFSVWRISTKLTTSYWIYNMRFSRYIAQMKWCCALNACIHKHRHYFICIVCPHTVAKIYFRDAMYVLHHYLTAWAVIRTGNPFQTLITGQASYSNSTSLLIQVSISSSQIQCLFYFEHPWSLTCGDFLFVIPAATCFPISSPI